MNVIKWDQATCSGCQIQLAQNAFDMKAKLQKATTEQIVVEWNCPNCGEDNRTLYEYSGDIDTADK